MNTRDAARSAKEIALAKIAGANSLEELKQVYSEIQVSVATRSSILFELILKYIIVHYNENNAGVINTLKKGSTRFETLNKFFTITFKPDSDQIESVTFRKENKGKTLLELAEALHCEKKGLSDCSDLGSIIQRLLITYIHGKTTTIDANFYEVAKKLDDAKQALADGQLTLKSQNVELESSRKHAQTLRSKLAELEDIQTIQLAKIKQLSSAQENAEAAFATSKSVKASAQVELEKLKNTNLTLAAQKTRLTETLHALRSDVMESEAAMNFIIEGLEQELQQASNLSPEQQNQLNSELMDLSGLLKAMKTHSTVSSSSSSQPHDRIEQRLNALQQRADELVFRSSRISDIDQTHQVGNTLAKSNETLKTLAEQIGLIQDISAEMSAATANAQSHIQSAINSNALTLENVSNTDQKLDQFAATFSQPSSSQEAVTNSSDDNLDTHIAYPGTASTSSSSVSTPAHSITPSLNDYAIADFIKTIKSTTILESEAGAMDNGLLNILHSRKDYYQFIQTNPSVLFAVIEQLAKLHYNLHLSYFKTSTRQSIYDAIFDIKYVDNDNRNKIKSLSFKDLIKIDSGVKTHYHEALINFHHKKMLCFQFIQSLNESILTGKEASVLASLVSRLFLDHLFHQFNSLSELKKQAEENVSSLVQDLEQTTLQNTETTTQIEKAKAEIKKNQDAIPRAEESITSIESAIHELDLTLRAQYELCAMPTSADAVYETNKLYIEIVGDKLFYTAVWPLGLTPECRSGSIELGMLPTGFPTDSSNLDLIKPFLPEILEITTQNKHTVKSYLTILAHQADHIKAMDREIRTTHSHIESAFAEESSLHQDVDRLESHINASNLLLDRFKKQIDSETAVLKQELSAGPTLSNTNEIVLEVKRSRIEKINGLLNNPLVAKRLDSKTRQAAQDNIASLRSQLAAYEGQYRQLLSETKTHKDTRKENHDTHVGISQHVAEISATGHDYLDTAKAKLDEIDTINESLLPKLEKAKEHGENAGDFITKAKHEIVSAGETIRNIDQGTEFGTLIHCFNQLDPNQRRSILSNICSALRTHMTRNNPFYYSSKNKSDELSLFENQISGNDSLAGSLHPLETLKNITTIRRHVVGRLFGPYLRGETASFAVLKNTLISELNAAHVSQDSDRPGCHT